MRLEQLSEPKQALNKGVTCDLEGLFVGRVPLLESDAQSEWRPRSIEDLNHDLSAVYGLPVDFVSKAGGVSAVAQALGRGALGQAQMVALHLRLPDPPDLAKSSGMPERAALALKLLASGLLKFNPDHWQAGSPGGIGGQFAPAGVGSSSNGERSRSLQVASLDGLAQGPIEPPVRIPEIKPAEPVKPEPARPPSVKPPEPARPVGQEAAEEAAAARSINARIRAAGLPQTGRIRFVPERGYDGTAPLKRRANGAYVDRFGNEWRKGPSRTPGQPFEWDVQLSRTGRAQIGHLSRDGQHVNVSMDGRVTHKLEA